MRCCISEYLFFFFKQKTAYEMRISDWSSDVCSSDLINLNSDLSDGLCSWCRSPVLPWEHQADCISRFDRVVGKWLCTRLHAAFLKLFLPARGSMQARRACGDRKSTRLNSSH